MRVTEQREDLIGRVRLLSRLTAVLLAVLAGAFWFVQVLQGTYYRDLADNNRLRKLSIKAPRGTIYDRKGRVLVENLPSYDLTLDRSHSGDLEASLAFAARQLGQPPERLRALLDRYTKVPRYAPVLLAESLSLPEVARFSVVKLEHPEFDTVVGHRRLYRLGPEASHVLGYLGEVSEDELDRPGSIYGLGDWVGRRGIERTFDRQLRGADGERVVVVDSRGQLVEEYGRVVGAPGEALQLTLDLELQQEAERLMEDKVGAVVALDPTNGEILAMVSSPGYDPNLFTRRLSRDDWEQLIGDTRHPLQNRALQNAYSPGSVFKVIVAAAGLAEGLIDENTSVSCGGGATFYGRRFRCWRPGGHGRVSLREAVARSCDVYFYTLGQRLGIERLARYAREFGLGRPTGIELEGEKPGLVPDPAWSLARRHHPWYAGETISVSIGQGPLLVTPLQLAAVAAAIGNGGQPVTPHLVRGATPPLPRLAIGARELALVRDAMWAVVNDGGTGGGVRVPGLEIAGKTGTVQVSAQGAEEGAENLPYELRNHAWFASFAPAGAPRLVVVVFVEHGAHGSSTAGPVAKALYERFFQVDHRGLHAS